MGAKSKGPDKTEQAQVERVSKDSFRDRRRGPRPGDSRMMMWSVRTGRRWRNPGADPKMYCVTRVRSGAMWFDPLRCVAEVGHKEGSRRASMELYRVVG